MSDRPDLEEIERRAEAATGGPWQVDEDSGRMVFTVGPGGYRDIAWAEQDLDDAIFIAASRTDIPALLAYVRELEAELRHERAVNVEDDEIVSYQERHPEEP